MNNKRKIIPTIKITLIFGIFLLFIKPAFAELKEIKPKIIKRREIIEKTYERKKEIDSKAKEYFLKEDESFYKNEYNEAITYLEKAIQIDPMSADLYYDYGSFYINLGKYEKAITYLEKSI